MLNVRQNTFETNSSSTHAFAIDCKEESFKYTDEHLEAFTELIYPFTNDELSMFGDPVIFTDLKDKVRYFWTVFVRECSTEDDSAYVFMGKLQKLLPQASFCLKFEPYTGNSYYGHFTAVSTVAYLEDANYVMSDDHGDDITMWDIETLKKLLLEGVIVFGDRDNVDAFGDSVLDNILECPHYKILNKISG